MVLALSGKDGCGLMQIGGVEEFTLAMGQTHSLGQVAISEARMIELTLTASGGSKLPDA